MHCHESQLERRTPVPELGLAAAVGAIRICAPEVVVEVPVDDAMDIRDEEGPSACASALSATSVGANSSVRIRSSTAQLTVTTTGCVSPATAFDPLLTGVVVAICKTIEPRTAPHRLWTQASKVRDGLEREDVVGELIVRAAIFSRKRILGLERKSRQQREAEANGVRLKRGLAPRCA